MRRAALVVALCLLAGLIGLSGWRHSQRSSANQAPPSLAIEFELRQSFDSNGFTATAMFVDTLPPDASLEAIRTDWLAADLRWLERIELELARHDLPEAERVSAMLNK